MHQDSVDEEVTGREEPLAAKNVDPSVGL